MQRFAALAAAALTLLGWAQPATAWFALSSVDDHKISLFSINDDASKGKPVATIATTAGEILEENNLACGRCFCLVLTTNPAAKKSFLYNVSFCIDPVPGVKSKVTLDYEAVGIHANLGEGDGGDGFTVGRSGANWTVTTIVGKTSTNLVDISHHVNARGRAGAVAPGGTAHCADSKTMWVSIREGASGVAATSTMIVIDLAAKEVRAVLSKVPTLTGHFANCKTQTAGGIRTNKGAVEIGELSAVGKFTVVDSVELPAGSNAVPTAVLDALETPGPSWMFQGFRAVLKEPGHSYSGLKAAGFYFTSEGTAGSAKLAKLTYPVMGLSVSY